MFSKKSVVALARTEAVDREVKFGELSFVRVLGHLHEADTQDDAKKRLLEKLRYREMG